MSKMKMYRYEIVRKFHYPDFKAGMTLPDTITFVNQTLAYAWRNGIRRKSKRGSLNYELIGFRFLETIEMKGE